MTDVHVPTAAEAKLRMYDGLPLDKDTSENAGFVALARTAGSDLLLWTSVYAISGRGAGQWVVNDGRMQGTMLLVVPADDDRPLHDNDFVRSGMHYSQILTPADHEVVVGEHRSEWRIGNRTYVWQPPTWKVTGEHAGVDLDLVFAPTGAAQWRWGTFDQLTENDSAGYEVGVVVNGTITAGATTYTIKNAPGFHERPSVGETRDVVRELMGGAEFTSAQFFTDDLKVALANHSGRGIKMGTVELGGRTYTFAPYAGTGSASFDILERWHDPRSGLSVPSSWHVALVSDEGVLDVRLTARARGYFHYLTSGGVMILMWLLARADGAFMLSDGTTHLIDNAPVGVRWGRNLLLADEQLS
jgi:hypothetical protein